MQTSLDELVDGAKPSDWFVIEVQRRLTGETKNVYFIADSKSYIICLWPLSGEVKFRAKSGEGIGRGEGMVRLERRA